MQSGSWWWVAGARPAGEWGDRKFFISIHWTSSLGPAVFNEDLQYLMKIPPSPPPNKPKSSLTTIVSMDFHYLQRSLRISIVFSDHPSPYHQHSPSPHPSPFYMERPPVLNTWIFLCMVAVVVVGFMGQNNTVRCICITHIQELEIFLEGLTLDMKEFLTPYYSPFEDMRLLFAVKENVDKQTCSVDIKWGEEKED